ncbi:MAG: SOS response-associated peptidase family protein [Elusimicrobia bacterium]|nr:SOS response-associated peptidase family protein [Elusimicrobiota bacterium]
MCSQFIVDKTGIQLGRSLKASGGNDIPARSRVVPRRPAPVVVRQASERIFKEMIFGLVPAWSPTPTVKFATHNARLMSADKKTGRNVLIYEKPTWREAFRLRHCLVPMTGFIEPIYQGELAGNMVVFRPNEQNVFAAAGIWEEWTSKTTGEAVSTFTVLTDDPVPDVERLGHDRTPVFLSEEDFDHWLLAESAQPQEMLNSLRSRHAKWRWSATIDRPLAPGWEKRA